MRDEEWKFVLKMKFGDNEFKNGKLCYNREEMNKIRRFWSEKRTNRRSWKKKSKRDSDGLPVLFSFAAETSLEVKSVSKNSLKIFNVSIILSMFKVVAFITLEVENVIFFLIFISIFLQFFYNCLDQITRFSGNWIFYFIFKDRRK